MINDKIAVQATEYWRFGKTVDAGKLIFENLEQGSRPIWASLVLAGIVSSTRNRNPDIALLLKIAGDPKEWKKAHVVFSKLRDSTLELGQLQSRSAEQELLLSQLGLAEIVAKVIYNATDPVDPFNEDSGWWVAVSLKLILDQLKDDMTSKSMWTLLTSEPKTPKSGNQ